jgi:hypothetical protein
MWGEPGPGEVSLTEITEAGCEAFAPEFYVTIDDCTDIDENSLYGVTIYPNPTSGKVNIDGMVDANIKIYNILGEEIFSVEHVNGQQTFNLSSYEKGIYLMKIEQDETVSAFQLVKQ